MPCERRHRFHQLDGRRVHACSHRHQLLELPQRHHRGRPDHAAAYSRDRGSVQQLPYQYRAELCDLHDEPFGGERQPLRLLSQWLVYGRRYQGRARYGLVARSRCDRRQGLHHLPCQRRHRLYQLVGRRVHPCSHRHQLFELPQRHYRDRPHHAAAYPCDRDSVQQLPHQYRAELCDVHDESLGGERQPLRLLSQRLLHGRGDQGRPRHRLSAGARRDQRQGLHHLPCRRRHRLYQLGGRRVHPCSHRHQLFELPQRHYRDRPDHTAAHSGERGSVQQLPHQYGAELHKLHNESLGGERQPLRFLSQRFLHRSGHPGRARDGFVRRSRSNQWYGLRHLPCQRGHRLHQLGRRQIYSCGHRHQLLELSQWHHGDRA